MLPVPNRYFKLRRTRVSWVIEDSVIPTVDEFSTVLPNCEPVLQKAGYYGPVELHGYIVDKNSELSPERLEHERDLLLAAHFRVELGGQGDKVTKFNTLLLDIMSWALSRSSRMCQNNLLLLVKDENFLGEDTKFSIVRQTMEKIGLAVGVAHPDTFKDFDGSDQSGSSQTEDQIGM